MLSRFSFPTNVVFGPGAVGETGDLARKLGGARAFIVADRGVAAAGLVEPVRRSLEQAGVEIAVFTGVTPNPVEADVDAGVTACRDARADLIVGLGGGSPLDTAKAVRFRLTHDGPIEQYDDNIGGDRLIRIDMPPMLAIPTTAGTGSEVGRSTVIICRSNDRKTVFFSPYLMPNYAICDPELTTGMPPHITAATGMDALTHSVEAFLAKPYHPMADGIALRGIKLVAENLPAAVQDGTNLEARTAMMMAAMMGATAFQKGLGAVHSLAHPLSSVAGMHHGLTNAILLPAVLEYNHDACPTQYDEVARTLNLSGPDTLAQWVRDLNAAIGIKPRLSDYGITADMIPLLAEKAMQDGCHVNNPKPCTAEVMRQLYRAAL